MQSAACARHEEQPERCRAAAQQLCCTPARVWPACIETHTRGCPCGGVHKAGGSGRGGRHTGSGFKTTLLTVSVVAPPPAQAATGGSCLHRARVSASACSPSPLAPKRRRLGRQGDESVSWVRGKRRTAVGPVHGRQRPGRDARRGRQRHCTRAAPQPCHKQRSQPRHPLQEGAETPRTRGSWSFSRFFFSISRLKCSRQMTWLLSLHAHAQHALSFVIYFANNAI